MIPKLLHRVWPGNDDFYKDYTENIKIFENCFGSSYEIKLWKGNDCLEFLEEYFPKYISFFIDTKSYATKSSLIRCLLLKIFGGIYSDFDVVIKDAHIKNLIEKYESLFITECILKDSSVEKSKSYRIRCGISEDKIRIADFFMASRKDHEVWDFVIKEFDLRIPNKILEIYDILYVTGPDVISTVINNNKIDDVYIVNKNDSDVFMKHEMDGVNTWRKKFKENI
jgi:mannosyltransferase OCH1-like enzyme